MGVAHRLLLACALAAPLALLAGCSAAQHQVIGMNAACSSCHSEDKATYDVPAPKGAASVGSRVMVETDAATIVVCKPLFTTEDGSSFVPVQERTAAVADGKAEVDLTEGVWVLCVDEGDTARATLVSVSAAVSAEATVKL